MDGNEKHAFPGRVLLAIVMFALFTLFQGLVSRLDAVTSPFPVHKKLIAVVVDDPPMVIKAANGEWSGFSVDLWRHIAKDLGVEYELREMRFSEVENALRTGAADLTVAPLYETIDRQRFLDFSSFIGVSHLAVAVPAEKDVHPFLAAIKVFFSWSLVEIAVVVLFILIFAGFIFWMSERKQNPDHFGGHPLKGIATGVYWVGSTLVSGICTGVSLKTTPGRIMGLLWILVGAVAFGALTASIASTLIARRQATTYAFDTSTLRRIHAGAVTGTTQASILEKLGGNYTLFEKTDDGIQALLANKIDGFLSSDRLLHYEELRYRKKISVRLTALKKMRFGFAFPANSPLREYVNTSLMAFMESPAWETLAARYGLTPDLKPIRKKGI